MFILEGISQLATCLAEGGQADIHAIEDGALAGIISIGDVVKSRVRELVTEAEQLSDYITHGR